MRNNRNDGGRFQNRRKDLDGDWKHDMFEKTYGFEIKENRENRSENNNRHQSETRESRSERKFDERRPDSRSKRDTQNEVGITEDSMESAFDNDEQKMYDELIQ